MHDPNETAPAPTKSKVLTLEGKPYAPEDDLPVDDATVEMLEDYLQRAKAGELVAVAVIAIRSDNCVRAGCTGVFDHQVEPMAGGLEVMKFRFLGNYFYEDSEI
jgi:hypothetical protein